MEKTTLAALREQHEAEGAFKAVPSVRSTCPNDLHLGHGLHLNTINKTLYSFQASDFNANSFRRMTPLKRRSTISTLSSRRDLE